MSWKINENSQIIGQPSELKMQLRHHQLCMLYKCLTIEKKGNKFGFMADKAGVGKTAVMISLIIADKNIYGKTQNLIIVPQNIISQWIDEINKFSNLSVKLFVEYSDISTLYYDSDELHKYDILITTTLYFDMIMSVLNQNGNNINRIIYDEIDTLDNVIKKYENKKKVADNLYSKNEQTLVPKVENKGLTNKIVWFISASLYNLIDKKTGFTFLGENVKSEDLGSVMVKCEDSFIESSVFKLETPSKILIKCESVIDNFFNYLSIEQLDYINSISFQKIFSPITNKRATNENEALKIIINDYFLSIERNKLDITDLSSKRNKSEDIIKQIDKKNKNNIFFNKIINTFHKESDCIDNNCNKQICIYNKIDKMFNNINKFKFDLIKQELLKIYNQNNNAKTLIFSDFSESFKLIETIENDIIKFTHLSKGNITEIDTVIKKYKDKNSDVNVLLIDSSNHSSGMNLENTTHLIFIHRTDETLRNQVIGRAQRPGRTSKLQIINFYNENEII